MQLSSDTSMVSAARAGAANSAASATSVVTVRLFMDVLKGVGGACREGCDRVRFTVR